MVASRAFRSWVGFNSRLIHSFRVSLYPRDITPKLLINSASYFGNNPRRSFDSARSLVRLEMNILEVKAYINRYEEMVEILNLMRMFPHGPDDFRPLNDLRFKNANLKLCRNGLMTHYECLRCQG